MRYWKAVYKTDNHGVYATGGIGGSLYTEFKVGETYEVTGEPELCKNGFHFYRANDFVFGIDLFGKETCFVEIKPLTDVVNDNEKCVATKIKIVKYIPKKQWKRKVIENRNSGYRNSGYRNSGDQNSGNQNSGNQNSGDRNSGNRNSGNQNSGNQNSGYLNSGNQNSGDQNSGDQNSGYLNSGNQNSGYQNSGNQNSGDWNSGDWNSGNFNSGNGYRNYFCNDTKYFLFGLEVKKEIVDKINDIPMGWFNLENETYHEAWAECPTEILKQFAAIKEFRTKKARKIFEEITGRNLPK
jgi:hypothetical protein